MVIISLSALSICLDPPIPPRFATTSQSETVLENTAPGRTDIMVDVIDDGTEVTSFMATFDKTPCYAMFEFKGVFNSSDNCTSITYTNVNQNKGMLTVIIAIIVFPSAIVLCHRSRI